MMSNTGALLNTLNNRMEGFERWQDHIEGTASSHTVFTGPPDAFTTQMPDEQAALSRPMAVEMHAPLPDVTDNARVHVTRRLQGSCHSLPLTGEDMASEDDKTSPPPTQEGTSKIG